VRLFLRSVMRFPVAKPVVTQDSGPAQWLAPSSQLYYVDSQPARVPSGGRVAARRLRDPRVNLPNLITLGRILLVPVIIWAITSGQMAVAFVLFFIAGVSDAVDGFLAKRFNMQSEIGALLDPLADKCLLVSIYIALGMTADVPRWLVILVVSRDIIIIGAVMVSWLVDRPVPMKPLMVSKLNTVAQVAFAALVLASLGFDFRPAPYDVILMGLVTVFTLASVSLYLVEWVRHMSTIDAH
jgi:cardiolipin synthase